MKHLSFLIFIMLFALVVGCGNSQSVADGADAGQEVIKAVSTGTNLLGAWGPIAVGVLGAISAVASHLAKRKSDKLKNEAVAERDIAKAYATKE
jgi:Na+-driven multidrug efflux pump